jgi:hypothetical protein
VRSGKPPRTPSGGESLRELPAPKDMPVSSGVEHRKAPERLPDCSKEPHGSCGSLEIRWFPGRSNALGRRPESVMVRPDASGRSARGNQRRREQPRRSGSDVLRRGLGGSGTMAMEPGRTGSSAFESAELPTSYSSEFEAVEHRRRQGAADAATHPGLPARKSPASETPGAAADPASPQGRREMKPSRG